MSRQLKHRSDFSNCAEELVPGLHFIVLRSTYISLNWSKETQNKNAQIYGDRGA